VFCHYPNDAKAVACGDQYLFGNNLLVAPVVERGATTRRVYLPRGRWYDFWTNEPVEGGREISREVNLEIIPLYVRAGSILPIGPVKQYTAEKVNDPLSIVIYPGGDDSFLLYEDDGTTFNYRRGEWMGVQMMWNEAQRSLTLDLADGSRMLSHAQGDMEVKLGQRRTAVAFTGRPIKVTF
jgi:alpha-glucosidase/alpha-D-xyloside xylohydrolase